MKFIHAADVHLDSPLMGLPFYEGAPVAEVRGATRRAFENLVDLAAAERVDFVLLAGDLYDGDWKDYNTGLFLSRQMARLRDEGIRVFVIAGNHDAASQITRHLRMPENVKIFSVRSPETIVIKGSDIAIHGQGYASRAVTDDLAAGYPDALPHHFNIGLLHTSLDGREGHETYAPTSVAGLLAKGYDYWALGHVHAQEIVKEDPWVVFSGNTQGRHIRETGPKGCMLVEVRDGRVARVKRHELDVMRWAVAVVDAGGAGSGDDAIEAASRHLKRILQENRGLPLAVRVEVVGVTKAHRELLSNPERWKNELRAVATDISDGGMWLEKIRFSTREENAGAPGQASAALLELMKSVDELSKDADLVQAAIEELSDLREKLPHELREGEEAILLEDPATLTRAAESVRQFLMERILSGGKEQ